ncbi:MAG: peptidyl-prolyl cis-trans isomerase [Herminiimonas sp.]|nr:peptidyl-prolyl cis-trans isomerase [Herminiimonas sp.]
MSDSVHNRKFIAAGLVVATIAVVSVAFFGLDVLRSAAATDIKKDAGTASTVAATGSRIVASVDGAEISEAELLPFLNAGLDRAVAVDRAINKVVAANGADKMYRQQAKTAMQSAKNDVLANVFINQRSIELRDSVSEADVKAFYDTRVKAEDFTAFRLKFFVSVDPKEAQEVFDGVGRGDKDALAKLAYAKKEGEHYVSAAEVPYGLGVAVKGLKAGERLRPVTVREGVLILYVEDIKANPKPALDKVKAEIKDLLITERFNADMKARRAASRIELRG